MNLKQGATLLRAAGAKVKPDLETVAWDMPSGFYLKGVLLAFATDIERSIRSITLHYSPNVISLGEMVAEVWDIPAHTAGHIALYFEEAKMIFTGDTLFAMGCGRLFEGTAAQMFAKHRIIAVIQTCPPWSKLLTPVRTPHL